MKRPWIDVGIYSGIGTVDAGIYKGIDRCTTTVVLIYAGIYTVELVL